MFFAVVHLSLFEKSDYTSDMCKEAGLIEVCMNFLFNNLLIICLKKYMLLSSTKALRLVQIILD